METEAGSIVFSQAGQPIGIEVGLHDLHVEDRDGRFAFYGVNGEVHWL